MQRRRVVKGNGNNADDGTTRKLAKKPSEEKTEETNKKKTGVFRKLGFILLPDKQDLGSTVKKRKMKKGTERKRRQPVWNPDKKVHFNLEKSHALIPLKGDPISDAQKKVFQKFAAESVKKSPPEYSIEFLSKVKPYPGHPMERKIFDANPTKNRYKDVVCNDVTRVILNDGYDGDYIHANYVNGLNVPFILTQGPTAATLIDFWRMVVHTKTSYIVMLCDTMEDGKPKCTQYWPEKVGDTATFGIWTIVCTHEDDKDANIIKRTLSIKNSDTGKEHILKHLHTKSWPDKSVPNSTLSLLRMLFIVRTAPGPVVVHCSAGIGRTGTFVAMEACLQILADGKELDLMNVVKAVRNSRAGSVQVDIQYMTLVQVLINYGKSNGYWDDSDLDDRVELLTWNIQQFIQSRGKVDHLMATPSTPNVVCAATPAAPVAGTPCRDSQMGKDPTAARDALASKEVPLPGERGEPRESPMQQTQAVSQMPPVQHHPGKPHKIPGVVTKDSTEEAEEAEEAKVQATQKVDVAPMKEEELGMQTVIPMAPVIPSGPPPQPPSPPKKGVSKENPKVMYIDMKEQPQIVRSAEKPNEKKTKVIALRKNRSEYFM